MGLLLGLLGGAAVLGLLVLWDAWSAPAPVRQVGSERDWTLAAWPIAGAIVGAVVAFALTGWAVAMAAGAAVGWLVVRAVQRRGHGGAKREQARIEALAAWCEQLRDLLSAEHGIIGTVVATARTAPEAIRDEVERLAARLSRQSPEAAVRDFAHELDDPSGDLVASVLVLAMSRSSRTSELLSELAVTIRDRAAMRLRVDADRAGQRGEARFVIGFSAVVIGGIVLFGRNSDFLDAYDDATGQAVLVLVAIFFALGGRWLSRLTRFERPARFLSVSRMTDDEVAR